MAEDSRLPILTIVGRPNVGKSSLFNRVVGRRLAIVHEESGVTRDRVMARATWEDRHFQVVDTGGLGFFQDQEPDRDFDGDIRDQLITALEGTRTAVLVVDATVGPLPLDFELARLLRMAGCRVLVAANKADNDDLADRVTEFYQLGFETVTAISALHNLGVGELMDRATDGFPESETVDREAPLHIAVVGRPNVGKSSTVNRLLGAERVIVSDVPGTTRDAIDVPLTVEVAGQQRQVTLVDTAGMRRRRQVDTAVEFFSVSRAQNAIKRADLVLIVLDATVPVTNGDKKIARLAADAGKPCLLLANKWDLAEGVKMRDLVAEIHRLLPFMAYAPTIVCCAQSGYNFAEILPTAVELHDRLPDVIPTALVNRVIQDCTLRMPPPTSSSGLLRIYYGVFRAGNPPTFLLFVNRTEAAQANYIAYMTKQFRRAFSLQGLPVAVELRNRRRESAAGKRPAKGRQRRGTKRRD